ncbi:MAG: hypothetical protein U0822_13230 [Anaerolineae bacterium]
MNFFFGLCLVIVAIIVAVAIWSGYKRNQRKAEGGAPESVAPGPASTRDPATQARRMLDRLIAVQPGQTIVTAMDEYYLVRGRVDLRELAQYGGSDQWTPTGRELVLIETQGESNDNAAFAYLPSAEGGALELFKMAAQNPAGWNQILAGTDDKPGPARAFADLDQRQDLQGAELESIRFKAFNTTWQMADIGQAAYTARGTAFLSGQGEVRFATAQEVDGSQRLLFINLLRGDSASEDGLFVGGEYPIDMLKDITPAARA